MTETNFIKSARLREINRDTDEWRSCHGYISKSGLVNIKRSPDHFKNGEPYVETPDKIFGRQYHCFVLQPELFKQQYYVFNDSEIVARLEADGKSKPRATNEYREWFIEQERYRGDRETISDENYQKITAMRDKLFAHPVAKMLLTGGVAEQGILGELETDVGTIGVKLIPDNRKDKKHIVSELKTTRDASAEGFAKECVNYDYAIQAALYSDIVELLHADNRRVSFFFIAQEKFLPYAFNIFEASPQFIAQGRYEYEMFMQLYKYCLDNDTWPGYQCWCSNKYGIMELRLPPWGVQPADYYIHKL